MRKQNLHVKIFFVHPCTQNRKENCSGGLNLLNNSIVYISERKKESTAVG